MRLFGLIVCWVLGSFYAFTQVSYHTRFYQWGVDAPADKMYSIAMSKDGYLWLAGDGGLHRFDGSRFINFSSNPYDSSSLPSDFVRNVFYDSFTHQLWLIYDKYSFAVFDCETYLVVRRGRIKPFADRMEDRITGLLFFEDKVVLATCYSGIYWLNRGLATKNFSRLMLKSEFGQRVEPNCSYHLIRDKNKLQTIWSLNPNGVERIDLSNLTVSRHTPQFRASERPLLATGLFDLAQTIDGTIWITSYSNGLYAWHEDSVFWRRYTLPTLSKDDFQATYKITVLDGQVYLGQDNRVIWQFNPETKTFKQAGIGVVNQSNEILCRMMLNGISGEIWTLDELGLGCYHYKLPQFTTFENFVSNKRVNVWGFNHDQYHYYLGAYNLEGIIRINKLKGKAEVMPFVTDDDYKFLNAKDLQWLDGRLLLSQAARAMYDFDPIEQRFDKLSIDWNGHIPIFTSRVHPLKKLLTCHKKEGRVYHTLSDLNNGSTIGEYATGVNTVIGIQNEWFYLLDSLNKPIRISARTGLMERAQLPDTFFELSNTEIKFLGTDAKGKVWYYAHKVGLMGFEAGISFRFNEFFQAISAKPFYHLKRVGGLQENYFYFYHHHHIYQLNPLTKEVRSIDLVSWLEPKEYLLGITIKGEEFMISTNLRSFFIAIDQWFIDGDAGEIRVSALSADGKSLPISATMHFNPGVKQIIFFFSRTKLILQDFIEYRYRRASDELWQQMERPELKFEYPSPGTYHFEVQARLNGSSWSDQTFHLIYHVQPYWYQSKWFIGALMSLVFMATFGIYRKWLKAKVNREQDKLKQELEKITLKINLFKSQMNPHFLFNALNGVNYLIISDKAELASQYLKKFSKLMRMVLNWSTKEWITLSDEIEFVNLYMNLETLRFQGKLRFECMLDVKYSLDDVNFPAMLLQPLLENAIWHGIMPKPDGGSITLYIQELNQSLHIRVQDNGVGRSSNAIENKEKGKSFGLELLNQRIGLLNQQGDINFEFYLEDLVDENLSPSGTIAHLIMTNVDL